MKFYKLLVCLFSLLRINSPLPVHWNSASLETISGAALPCSARPKLLKHTVSHFFPNLNESIRRRPRVDHPYVLSHIRCSNTDRQFLPTEICARLPAIHPISQGPAHLHAAGCAPHNCKVISPNCRTEAPFIRISTRARISVLSLRIPLSSAPAAL